MWFMGLNPWELHLSWIIVAFLIVFIPSSHVAEPHCDISVFLTNQIFLRQHVSSYYQFEYQWSVKNEHCSKGALPDFKPCIFNCFVFSWYLYCLRPIIEFAKDRTVFLSSGLYRDLLHITLYIVYHVESRPAISIIVKHYHYMPLPLSNTLDTFDSVSCCLHLVGMRLCL